jgi:hypothetical protein
MENDPYNIRYTIILVAGAITILKNDGLRQWGWDDIPNI